MKRIIADHQFNNLSCFFLFFRSLLRSIDMRQIVESKGINAPFPVPDEAFMVIELAAGSLTGITGTVRYPSVFDDV